MYLRKIDYYKQIQEDNLDVIIEDVLGVPTVQFLTDCEAAALKEVQSYLSHRYDTATIFKPLLVYDNAVTYQAGDWVAVSPVETGLIWTAQKETVGNAPAVGEFWKQEDSRDALMKTYLIDVTLYHVHSRLNPRNIKALVMSRRDEAIKWLGMISSGKINADLPLITEDVSSGDRIIYGSETKRINTY
jgi:hypothetical protein